MPRPRRRAAQVRVFISHAEVERELATAWKDLLEGVSLSAVQVWFSSDPAEGVRPGRRWRAEIDEALARCDYVIALQSGASLARPWIFWECGVAKASNRRIVVVTYDLSSNELCSVVSDLSAYNGRNIEDVERVCRDFLDACNLNFDRRLFFSQYKKYATRTAAFCSPPKSVPPIESYPDIMKAIGRAFELCPAPHDIDILGHSTSRLYAYLSARDTDANIRVLLRNPSSKYFLPHVDPKRQLAERKNIRAALEWWRHGLDGERSRIRVFSYDFEPSFCLVRLDNDAIVLSFFIPTKDRTWGHSLGESFVINGNSSSGHSLIFNLTEWYRQTVTLKGKELRKAGAQTRAAARGKHSQRAIGSSRS